MSVGSDFKGAIDSIGKTFTKQGFVASQKGQVLKKVSSCGEFVFHIRFQPVRIEKNEAVEISCFIGITAERLGTWRLKTYKNKDSDSPQVFYANLKDILPAAAKLVSWKLSAKRRTEVIEEVHDALQYYALAMFALFEERERLLPILGEQGWHLNAFMEAKQFVYPLDFILCYTSHAYAAEAFNGYIKEEGWIDDARQAFELMSRPTYKGFLESDLPRDKAFQLAYFHGIRIEE